MTSYFLKSIATTDVFFSAFDNNGAPAINDSGTLTWKAFLKDGGSGIFVGNGQGFSPIADTTQGFTAFGYSTINNNGTTAFYGETRSGQSGIYIGSGESTTVVAYKNQTLTDVNRTEKFTSFLTDPAINDSNQVAFLAGLTGNNSGLFVGNDHGNITRIADTVSPFSGLQFADFLGTPFEGDVTPAINAQGQVAFWGLLDDRLPKGSAEYDQIPSQNKAGNVRGIFVADEGGNIRTVADNTQKIVLKGTEVGYLSFAGSPDINNNGLIAYVFRGETSNSDGSPVRGINLYDKNGRTTTVVDNRKAYSRFGAPDINDVGDLAFRAQLDAPSGKDPVTGIYTGADPDKDKVIETGDSINDKEISDLLFFNKGLNNKGQIAFLAFFKDGSQGMYRADPCGAGDYKIKSLCAEQADLLKVNDAHALSNALTPRASLI